MFQLALLTGKPVIDLYHARTIGTVSSIGFDKRLRRAKTLIVKTPDGFSSLPLFRVLRFGEDAVTVKCGELFTPSESAPSLLSCPCFSTDGKLLGSITDIHVGEHREVLSIFLNGEQTELDILSCSEVVIAQSETAPIRLSAPKHRSAKTMIFEEHPIEADGEKAKESPSLSPFKPPKLLSGSSLLLGRQVLKDVHDREGHVIIRANTLITQSTIEAARKADALFDLIYHSSEQPPTRS